jgi:hypothetical protein
MSDTSKEWSYLRTKFLHTMWQDGFSYSEMAEVLGVSRSAIAGKVSRMRDLWEAAL